MSGDQNFQMPDPADSNADQSTNTVPRLLTIVLAATAASPIYVDRCHMRSRLQLDFVVLRTADPYLANVLLEAERRYGAILAQNGVENLSIFCGWHRSWKNPQYHYTLRGYNAAGWMSFTVEMEAGNRGREFPYGQPEWNDWLARARGNPAMLRAKHFFDPADHVETGISWEGSATGVVIAIDAVHAILSSTRTRPESPCSEDGLIFVSAWLYQ
ncbi:hypothetical protein EDD18DRAFT_1100459 [Armillaria luteobubalina]|uniref:Uncharacterized protein n=1 Tax=Armillaria luteobubalina TaxID=153913 RepID=A0AA39V1N8_9AGAR|nr:hypothetical protein EDD18DRAFT_1100459 [Armillaria luteobubalina]